MSWLNKLVEGARGLIPWMEPTPPTSASVEGGGVNGSMGAAEAAAPSFRLGQPTFSQRWSVGAPANDPTELIGFKPVGQIRQPSSPPTIEVIQQKLLMTKTDTEKRKAELESAMSLPTVIENLEVQRRREQEAEAKLAEYQKMLAEAPPLISADMSATLPEALAGLGAGLFGVRGDRAAAGTLALGERRRQIADQNARSQWEARQRAAGLEMDLSQARAGRAGAAAGSYEEMAQRIRQAALSQALGEEEWQKNRVARLEDVQSERNWTKEVMELDRKTAIEKMALADQLDMERSQALALFQAQVIKPLQDRQDARAEGISLAMKALTVNRDPAQVAALVRGLEKEGISVPSGWQSLFMAQAVMNRDDAAFEQESKKKAQEIESAMLGLQIKRYQQDERQMRADAMRDGVAFDAQGNPRPMEGSIGGGGNAPMPVGGPPPVVTKSPEGKVTIQLQELPEPEMKGTEIPALLKAAQEYQSAQAAYMAARDEIIQYKASFPKDTGQEPTVPARLKEAEAKAKEKVDAAKQAHRGAMGRARGAKGNEQYWAFVEAWRVQALEALKAVSQSGLAPGEKLQLQEEIRERFSLATGASLTDVPSARVK